MIQRKFLNLLRFLVTDNNGSDRAPNELLEAQIRYSFSGCREGARGSLAAAVILTVVLWRSAPHLGLLLWFACYAAAFGLRETLTWKFNKADAHGEEALLWRKRLLALVVVEGLLWGLTPILLFPNRSFPYQVMPTFVICGMSVGMALSCATMKEAYTPFILLVYLPLIARFFCEGHSVYRTMAALLIMFMVYLLGSTLRAHRTGLQALKFRYRNARLINDLTQRKTAALKLNQALRTEMEERTRAEALLRQSERKYRQLFEISPDAMAVHSEGKILLANRAAAALLKAPNPEALVGRSIWDFVHHDYTAQSRERMNQLKEQKRAAEPTELKFVALDKTLLDVETASVPSSYRDEPAVLTVTRDITQAKQAERRLKASLEEKEILLREIHHRVKNNLQIISSLLKLQSKFAGSKSPKDVFSDSEIRLHSMSLLHEMLYESSDLANIDFRAYVGTLVSNLLQLYGNADKQIIFENTVDQTRLSLDTAIPCGLIVNELVSNCLKHAFPNGRQGKVEVSLASLDKEYRLLISDDGVGLPQNVDPPNPDTLGLRLVNALVRQLRGRVSVDRSRGTEYQIIFAELNSNRRTTGYSGST
jgi:PAS domain S-box-containing protein